jgi:hypothetical protein
MIDYACYSWEIGLNVDLDVPFYKTGNECASKQVKLVKWDLIY